MKINMNSLRNRAIPAVLPEPRNGKAAISRPWNIRNRDRVGKVNGGQNFNLLRYQVDDWFTPRWLDFVMGSPQGRTERIARSWLMRPGNRWRPFTTVAAYEAICKRKPGACLPADIRKIAIAIECHHKGSLAHDDIEDDYQQRHGEKTLHVEYGVPLALNVGDLLIGESYRLIGDCAAPARSIARMLAVAAHGQSEVCRGRGAEICCGDSSQQISLKEVISIYRRKTAPTFEIALRLGVILAGTRDEQQMAPVLRAYSGALGIAYQIQDDLSDLGGDGHWKRIVGRRPTLLLAAASDRAQGGDLELLERFRRRDIPPCPSKIEPLYYRSQADQYCARLLETYKHDALKSLDKLNHSRLKTTLQHLIEGIFNDEVIEPLSSTKNIGDSAQTGVEERKRGVINATLHKSC